MNMGEFGNAVICVCAAAFICSVVLIISPGKKVDGMLRAVAGIFITVTLFRPLTELLGSAEDIFESFEVENTEVDYAASFDAGSFIGDEIRSIIEADAKKYSINIVSAEADVTVENDCIIIHGIRVYTNEADDEKLNEFRKSAEEKTGVSIIVEDR